MKKQSGITLVELLAGMAITGIIIILIVSVLSTGSNASQRTATKQQLQQEGNYIVEVIRNEYLKLNGPIIELKIEGTGNQQKLIMGNQVISQGYSYKIINPVLGKIDPAKISSFQLELSAPGSKPFVINTTFSKLR